MISVRKKTPSASGGGSLFFFFTVIGAAFIVAAKSQVKEFDDSGFYKIAVTAVPVLLICVYAGVLHYTPKFRLSDDQAGDNLYYLGFLYTLISLAVALYQFEPEGGAKQIVTNFGIAIASTIAGLALRVAFNQMRPDPNAIEKKARFELADAARRVKRELNSVTLEFKSFGRAMEQSIKETSARTFDPLQKTLRDSTAQMGNGFEIFNQQTERLTGNSERAVSALEALTARLENIKAPDDLIVSRLTPAVEQVETLVSAVKETNEQHSLQMQVAIKTAAAAASSAKESADSAAGVIRAVKTTADAASESAVLVAKTSAGLSEKTGEDMRQLAERINELSGCLNRAVKELEGLAEAAGRERAAQNEAGRQPRLFGFLRRN